MKQVKHSDDFSAPTSKHMQWVDIALIGKLFVAVVHIKSNKPFTILKKTNSAAFLFPVAF